MGKPFTLTLTGRNLGEGAKIRSTMPATFTLLTPDLPAQLRGGAMQTEGRYATFLVEPTADLSVGVYPIRVVTSDGISNIQLFTVGAFPELLEDESQPGALPNTSDNMEDAQALPPPPFTLNGTLRGPERDMFRLSAKAGEKRVIEIEARRCGSAIDPLLEILDANGRVIARSEDEPLLGLDARVEVAFPRRRRLLRRRERCPFFDADRQFLSFEGWLLLLSAAKCFRWVESAESWSRRRSVPGKSR